MQVYPSQISPAENFDIFYFLRNPNDSGTYYCRAVIRDLKSGVILATVDLDQSVEPHLFIKTIQAPGDSTGLGRNIVAIATLYTDSGYTQKSADYEEQEQYFLIKAQQNLGGGGGIDYRALREMVTEIVDKAISTIPKPPLPQPLPDMPFDALFGAIGALQREINRIPKDAADLAPITHTLSTIEAAIRALPEPEKLNLRPVLEAISGARTDIQDMRTERDYADTEQLTKLGSVLRSTGVDIAKEIQGAVVAAIENQEITVPAARVVNKERLQPPIDIRSLMHQAK